MSFAVSVNTTDAHQNGDSASIPPSDTGLVCLVIIARYHNLAVDQNQLRHEFAIGSGEFSVTTILLAAKKLGLFAREHRPTSQRLNHTPLPAIACSNDGSFFILARIDQTAATAEVPAGHRFVIQDPQRGKVEILSESDFLDKWEGGLILFTSRSSVLGDLARFDFSWFIPSIIKYRKLLLEVLGISVVLQLAALGTPLFFQVVMDKVLVNRAFSTLDVMAVGLLGITLFEIALSLARSYLFAHTSSRIDIELGTRLFRHLLDLPLAYFHSRRVGDSVARAQELENIRNFLTGNAITVLLDLVFSIFFIALMLWYSPWLTLIVVISLPCYFAVSLFFTPLLRNRLDDKFKRHAENQSFLVESVTAIDTIKSMAVEPQWSRKWDQQLAGYVSAGFKTVSLGMFASNGVSLISKLVTLATLWMGAKLVIEGKLTVGQLIAFNMLANHVSAPVIRLAQLWTDFQQIGVAVKRLGDILNVRTELAIQRNALPPLKGAIRFEDVIFRYRVDGPTVIRHLNLDIAPGEIIGIVGRSGSGKSTLAKLAQRMFVAESGRIFVDSIDIGLANVSSLRRQIGVVLQENMLFNRSIRENIALADPAMPLERVIEAATLAGAHEFISELPDSYDTLVGEQGVGLSGGQRQRIAIARSLISNPKILIFDEATSSLDYESERIIQDNMRVICKGRTVLIIAHRLSAVRDADRIVVMDRGEITEMGTHASLLAQGGQYAHLHSLQQG